MSLALLLAVFWVMQILANVAFKYGSADGGVHSRRWWAGFMAGNLVGASSICFLMRIYGMMPSNPNLAAVMAGSGAFIGSQLALAWIFKSRLSRAQWTGVALVALGTTAATLGR